MYEIIVHALTMIIVHASCPTGLMFGAIQVGGSGGEASRDSRGVEGPRGPPSGAWWEGDSPWILGDGTISGDGQGWVDVT